MKKVLMSSCLAFAVFLPTLCPAANDAAKLVPVYTLLLSNTPTYHNVNVITTGLGGTGFSLMLNDKYELPIPADGLLTFPARLRNLTPYRVSIKSPSSGVKQACIIDNGTGILASEDANVKVTFANLGYPVGGTVSGLDGAGLTLALEDLTNGGVQQRVIKADGDFVLAALQDGASYQVAVFAQPANRSQTCTLANASGTVTGAAITDIGVACVTRSFAVRSSIYGLVPGASLEITNNEGLPDATTITVNGTDSEPVKGSSFFVEDGNTYSLSVTRQPKFKTCQLTNVSGSIDGANVTNVEAHCSDGLPRSISGTIGGLGIGMQERTVTIGLNEGLDTLDFTTAPTMGPVSFGPFTKQVPEGSSYLVDIVNQPAGQKCTVTGGSGIVSGDVTDVAISCATYIEPVAKVIVDAFVPNGGALDGSSSTLGDSTSLTYNWSAASARDYFLTGNGTMDPYGVAIRTDVFDDPAILDDIACMADPLCVSREAIKEIANSAAVVQTVVVGNFLDLLITGDEGHESTDSGNTYVYNENYAYVKRGGTGTGASPDNAAGDIKSGIGYAWANNKSMVAIAEGTYTINIDEGPITMLEGVSLSGGYSASTWKFDPETYRTEIRSQGTGELADHTIVKPLGTVLAGPDITDATFIRGLRIYGPSLLTDIPTTALLIDGGDPAIKFNRLTAFDQRKEGWTGLTILNGSRSQVKYNTIIAWEAGYSGDLYDARVGSGVVIYNSTPVIMANRIRGGGGKGQGIRVFNAEPDIFNNTILGCEDGTSTQVCYGVAYLGGSGKAGGKLYNNTIFGGMSYPDSGDDLGGESIAVLTAGTKASPEVVNNILYAQNAAEPIFFGKTACIYSDSVSRAAMPASIYNNACIRGPDNCFHWHLAPEDTSIWEDVYEMVSDSFANIGNQFLNIISFGYIPRINYFEGEGFNEVCRIAASSNLDQIYQNIDVPIGLLHISYIPSNGNIDIDSASFADINGLDNDFFTIDDNDWSLTPATPPEVRLGGKCLAPDISTDITGSRWRTPHWNADSGCEAETGWSIGAYEY